MAADRSEILQKLLQPSPAAVASHLARQAATPQLRSAGRSAPCLLKYCIYTHMYVCVYCIHIYIDIYIYNLFLPLLKVPLMIKKSPGPNPKFSEYIFKRGQYIQNVSICATASLATRSEISEPTRDLFSCQCGACAAMRVPKIL